MQAQRKWELGLVSLGIFAVYITRGKRAILVFEGCYKNVTTNMVASNNQKLFSHSQEARSLKSSVRIIDFFRRLWGRNCPILPSSFWWFPAMLAFLHSLAYGSVSPFSAPIWSDQNSGRLNHTTECGSPLGTRGWGGLVEEVSDNDGCKKKQGSLSL